MTTELVTMQSHGGFRFREPELDHRMASEISNLYGPQDAWAPGRGGKPLQPGMNRLGYPVTTTPPPDGHYQLNTTFQQNSSSVQPGKRSHDSITEAPAMYTTFAPTPENYSNSTLSGATNPAMYSAPSMFTATNSQRNAQIASTISPLQTRFDINSASPTLNDPLSFNGQVQQQDNSGFMNFTTDSQIMVGKRRYDSPQRQYEGSSPSTTHSSGGRRRRSENAEPGSARAIYLEKNRKAASKCRSKQKMQQEDLVETAREVERKNRALKAEVEMLKGGLRELMEIVSQHNDCADGRLRTYVQREADRLASGSLRPPYMPSSLPFAGSTSSGGNGSPTSGRSIRS